ncbi:MAG: holo-ACP synthase [Magnetococcales bacterium]|nr:holo-ACP synthase [Magnetococcales bacterium]
MMILGIGTDLVKIERLEQAMTRFQERFIGRIFTPAEQRLCGEGRTRYACYAKRFAAKESLVKALGVGMREGIWFTDMEILNDDYGKPVMTLSGKTERRLHALMQAAHFTSVVIHLALSDEGGFALAHLVLEGRNKLIS